MNSANPVIDQSLTQLTTRLRWIRWLRKLHRFVWIVAGLFLTVFAADVLLGLRTLDLRIAGAMTLLTAVVLFAADWLLSWQGRIDLVGLAHLLERSHPDLAERLVTLVQLQAEPAVPMNAIFARLLERETEQHLAQVQIESVCPLAQERTRWMISVPLLLVAFVGLFLLTPMGQFSGRFCRAWFTPLVPFEIELVHGNRHALRGASYAIEARYRQLDSDAKLPTECVLVCVDDTGATKRVVMQATAAGGFISTLDNLQAPVRFHAEANGIASISAEVRVVDPPAFVGFASVHVVAPKYLGERFEFDVSTIGIEPALARYSTIEVRFALDRPARHTWLIVGAIPDREQNKTAKHPVRWTGKLAGESNLIAATAGIFEAKLLLELEHGLTTTLPVASWRVLDDLPPRFTEPIRLQGEGSNASAAGKHGRIAPDDVVRVQAAVEDREGLEAIEIEYRVNDEPAQVRRWLDARGKKELTINDWLPLPKTLKEDDRFRFRLRAIDKRRMSKGEVNADPAIPAEALLPQVTIAPTPLADGDDRWIELRVDRSIEGFLKEQIQAQSNEVRGAIDKIKLKLQSESAQLAKLKSAMHQQPVLSPELAQQAAKIRVFNQEIADDLTDAGELFGKNDALANLAEHFHAIAESEMRQSGKALDRFAEKEREQVEREKEVPIAQELVMKAIQKLDRMFELNKLLAEDRLDQWQLEKFAKQQQALADRLQQLLDEPNQNDAALAKQIEEIRQEQARLAAQVAKMQEQSRLLQESMAVMQERRVQRLTKTAQELARMQREMEPLDPAKMPAELAEQVAKLAERQEEFAQRASAFAAKNDGPKGNAAQAAAAALKKRLVEEGLERQREQERQLKEWIEKLLPGIAQKAVHDQTRRLAEQQKKIRDDLAQLGKELGQLNEMMLRDRLGDLLKRQRELKAAVAKLPIDRQDDRLRQAQQSAESIAEQAGDQLAAKDALSSFESMEKSEKALQALAGMLPKDRPQDATQVKDPAERAKVEQVQKHAREQEHLREETEKLLAAWAKAAGKEAPVREGTEKLASELVELSQKGGPEGKGMAKEAAQTVDDAKKAMAEAQALREKGESKLAKEMDANAAKQLDIAVKQLEKFAQEMAMKGPAKENAEKPAEALAQSQQEMRMAEKNLPAMPKDAQTAMKNAAQKLEQAADQTAKQADRNLPRPTRDPAAKAGAKSAPGSLSAAPNPLKLDSLHGKAWGQLPGELKTRMMQDFRARYGDDYAEIIQQYFERLAESPASNRK